jgi:hypothetical protein
VSDHYQTDHVTSGNGPRYDHSAAAAAEILQFVDSTQPNALLFGKILFSILRALYNAEAELNQGKPERRVNVLLENLIADSATKIYNLGIASTDRPAHERFGLIVKVMRQTVDEALASELDRLLKSSRN